MEIDLVDEVRKVFGVRSLLAPHGRQHDDDNLCRLTPDDIDTAENLRCHWMERN